MEPMANSREERRDTTIHQKIIINNKRARGQKAVVEVEAEAEVEGENKWLACCTESMKAIGAEKLF